MTRIGSLAVVEGDRILGQTTIDTQLRHNARLISSLDNLVKSLGISISDIDTIAVDLGPGSFTGIRVGIASAKGLAQPDGKQLLGACSLDVLSRQAIERGVQEGIKFLIPVIDAKRGMMYSAVYGLDGRIIKEPYLTTMDMLQKEKSADKFLFGPEIDNTYPDAGIVARFADKKNLEPMYIYDIEYRK